MRYFMLIVSLLLLSGCLGGIQDQMAADRKAMRVQDCEKRITEETKDGKKITTEHFTCKEWKEQKTR